MARRDINRGTLREVREKPEEAGRSQPGQKNKELTQTNPRVVSSLLAREARTNGGPYGILSSGDQVRLRRTVHCSLRGRPPEERDCHTSRVGSKTSGKWRGRRRAGTVSALEREPGKKNFLLTVKGLLRLRARRIEGDS